MPDILLPRDKNLKPRSTELRTNATKQEKRLWYDFLKRYSLHFYRQRIIGDYIVDFYCPKAKLVIEVDGSQHFEDDALEYDKVRTEFLNALDLHVIRFTNKEVDENFDGVCQMIDIEVQARIKSPVTLRVPPSLKRRAKKAPFPKELAPQAPED